MAWIYKHINSKEQVAKKRAAGKKYTIEAAIEEVWNLYQKYLELKEKLPEEEKNKFVFNMKMITTRLGGRNFYQQANKKGRSLQKEVQSFDALVALAQKKYPKIEYIKREQNIYTRESAIDEVWNLYQKYLKLKEKLPEEEKNKFVFNMKMITIRLGGRNLYVQANTKGLTLQKEVGSFDELVALAQKKYPKIEYVKSQKTYTKASAIDEVWNLYQKYLELKEKLPEEEKKKFVFNMNMITTRLGGRNLYKQANKKGSSLQKEVQSFDNLVALAQKKYPKIEYIKREQNIYTRESAIDEVWNLYQKYLELKEKLPEEEQKKWIFNTNTISKKLGGRNLYVQANKKGRSLQKEVNSFDELLALAQRKYSKIKYVKSQKTYTKKSAIEEVWNLYQKYLELREKLPEEEQKKWIFNTNTISIRLGGRNLYAQANTEGCDLQKEIGSFFNLLVLAMAEKNISDKEYIDYLYQYLSKIQRRTKQLTAKKELAKDIYKQLMEKQLYHEESGFHKKTEPEIIFEETFLNSKNPTFTLSLDHRRSALDLFLSGQLSTKELEESLFIERQFFVKAYSGGEKERAQRECEYSIRINQEIPGLILTNYHFLGNIGKHTVNTHTGKADQFIVAPLLDGQTLAQSLVQKKDDPLIDEDVTPEELENTEFDQTEFENYRYELLLNTMSALAKFHSLSADKELPKDKIFSEQAADLQNKINEITPITSFDEDIFQAVIHKDAHFDNIWVSNDGEIQFLDIEKICRGNVLYDLMHLLVRTDIAQEDKISLLEHYWSERGHDEFFSEGDLLDQIKVANILYKQHVAQILRSYDKVFENHMEKVLVAIKNYNKQGLLESIKEAGIALENVQRATNALKALTETDKINKFKVHDERLAKKYARLEALRPIVMPTTYIDPQTQEVVLFRSRQEREIALTLQNLLSGFSISKNTNVKLKRKEIDFLFEYQGKKIAIEYHPVIWERIKYNDYTTPDEILIDRYRASRQELVGSGTKLLVIPEHPLTVAIIRKALSELLPLKKKEIDNAWQNAQDLIMEYETEYPESIDEWHLSDPGKSISFSDPDSWIRAS